MHNIFPPDKVSDDPFFLRRTPIDLILVFILFYFIFFLKKKEISSRTKILNFYIFWIYLCYLAFSHIQNDTSGIFDTELEQDQAFDEQGKHPPPPNKYRNATSPCH